MFKRYIYKKRVIKTLSCKINSMNKVGSYKVKNDVTLQIQSYYLNGWFTEKQCYYWLGRLYEKYNQIIDSFGL